MAALNIIALHLTNIVNCKLDIFFYTYNPFTFIQHLDEIKINAS